MARFKDAIALASQIPRRVEAPDDLSDPTFPFNRDTFDKRTNRPPPSGRTPSAVATGAGITAGGILIRDGSEQMMRRVPDFESILDSMTKNRKNDQPA